MCQEQSEIDVIKRYMPEQLGADELDRAIGTAIAESNAQNGRDMGKVMAILKDKYAGQINMSEVGSKVKTRLNG